MGARSIVAGGDLSFVCSLTLVHPAPHQTILARCKDKARLSLGDKLEIVRRNVELHPEHAHFRTQAQLAQMFGKSRAAISKIVRPENIEKLKQKAAAGLDPKLKRHTWRDWSQTHMELEQRVIRYAEEVQRKAGVQCTATQVCKHAVEIAQELGLDDFKTKSGWYAWYARLQRRQAQNFLQGPSGEGLPSQHQLHKQPGVDHEPAGYVGHAAGGGGARSLKTEPLVVRPSTRSKADVVVSDGFLANQSLHGGQGMPLLPSDNPNDHNRFAALPDSGHNQQQHANGAPSTRPYCKNAMSPSDAWPHGHMSSSSSGEHAAGTSQKSAFVPAMRIPARKRAVNVKTTFIGSAGQLVYRRLRIDFDMTSFSVPLEGFKRFMHIISSAHKHDPSEHGALSAVFYVDDERDIIPISSDHELVRLLPCHGFMTCPPPRVLEHTMMRSRRMLEGDECVYRMFQGEGV